MNPTQIERVAAPVIVNQTEKGYGVDPVSSLNNIGIQRLSHDIGDTNRDVKDAEANIRYGVKDAEADIRHDVLFEGQENQKTSLEVEARLKDRLTIDRNAWDMQFQNLNNRICETDKGVADTKLEVIKQGYEARLLSKDAIIDSASRFQHLSERLGDKVAHGFEETEEKLDGIKSKIQSCCCEQELANATQTGLLNLLVSALNVK